LLNNETIHLSTPHSIIQCAALRDILGASLRRALASRARFPSSCIRGYLETLSGGLRKPPPTRMFFVSSTACSCRARARALGTTALLCRTGSIRRCISVAVVRRIRRRPRDGRGVCGNPAMSHTPCSRSRPDSSSEAAASYLTVVLADKLD
jgi:hypothetical protein